MAVRRLAFDEPEYLRFEAERKLFRAACSTWRSIWSYLPPIRQQNQEQRQKYATGSLDYRIACKRYNDESRRFRLWLNCKDDAVNPTDVLAAAQKIDEPVHGYIMKEDMEQQVLKYKFQHDPEAQAMIKRMRAAQASENKNEQG